MGLLRKILAGQSGQTFTSPLGWIKGLTVEKASELADSIHPASLHGPFASLLWQALMIRAGRADPCHAFTTPEGKVGHTGFAVRSKVT